MSDEPTLPLATPVVVRGHQCERTRWRNGLGWTREVARARVAPGRSSGMESGPHPAGWDWRLSVAEIDTDGDFSSFPGAERALTLLTGNGVGLRAGDDGRWIGDALPPHGSVRFSGDLAVRGVLVEGRVQVLNLMWRRAALSAECWFRPLVGPMLVFADPRETWLLHLVAGQARLDRNPGVPVLEAGDSIVLAARDARARCLLEGAGEVVLAKLVPAAQ